jgi:ATP-dependent Clp protease, protease subunit
MGQIIARHSGQPLEKVMKDIDRDHFMTPDEAVDYGLADAVLSPRGLPAPVAAGS